MPVHACACAFFSPETAIWICDVLLCILPSCRSCDALHPLHYYVFRRLHSDTSLLLPFKTYPFLLSPAPVKYMYCIFSKCCRMTACCRFQKIDTLVKAYIFLMYLFLYQMPVMSVHRSVRLLRHRISVSVSISVLSAAAWLLVLNRILSLRLSLAITVILRLSISRLLSVSLLRL